MNRTHDIKFSRFQSNLVRVRGACSLTPVARVSLASLGCRRHCDLANERCGVWVLESVKRKFNKVRT